MMVLEVLIVMRWRGIFNLFFLVIIKLLLYYIYDTLYILCIHRHLCTNVHTNFGRQILLTYLLLTFDRPISRTNTQFGGN